jgi:Cu2+-containing amine oxidase
MQAVTSIMSTLGLKGKPTTSPSLAYHPLNPLDTAEMTAAASAVDQYLRAQDSVQAFSRLWYKAVTLKEPPKAQLAPYLDAIAAGHQVDQLSRQVDVLVGAKRGKEAATWYGESRPRSSRSIISPPTMSLHPILRNHPDFASRRRIVTRNRQLCRRSAPSPCRM